MLFRSRQMPGLVERLRLWLWPRRSWRRSWTYIAKRILRMRATPHAVAAGVAAGVFAIVTPFLGMQMLIAVLLAYVIGGNIIAALIGTWAGNPLTYPLIWAATLQFGSLMLGGPDATERMSGLGDSLVERPMEAVGPVLVPMAAGAIPVGIATAALTYLFVRAGVGAYQSARAK